jgi:hypothetical protein
MDVMGSSADPAEAAPRLQEAPPDNCVDAHMVTAQSPLTVRAFKTPWTAGKYVAVINDLWDKEFPRAGGRTVYVPMQIVPWNHGPYIELPPNRMADGTKIAAGAGDEEETKDDTEIAWQARSLWLLDQRHLGALGSAEELDAMVILAPITLVAPPHLQTCISIHEERLLVDVPVIREEMRTLCVALRQRKIQPSPFLSAAVALIRDGHVGFGVTALAWLCLARLRARHPTTCLGWLIRKIGEFDPTV